MAKPVIYFNQELFLILIQEPTVKTLGESGERDTQLKQNFP